MAFQTLSASFMGPVTQLVGLGATVQMLEADMNRLDDVMQYPIDPQLAPDAERRRRGRALPLRRGRAAARDSRRRSPG
jgi:ABC-type bacteriocin/lantibiotic exporter with double-glycine peptidase domain